MRLLRNRRLKGQFAEGELTGPQNPRGFWGNVRRPDSFGPEQRQFRNSLPMTRFVRCAMAVWGKDLVMELRRRETISTILFFGLLVVFLFGFALGPDAGHLRRLAPALLWVTVLLSAVIALERSFQAEAEEGCLDRLILYTVSHRATFLGKCLTNFCFVAIVQCVGGVAMVILYDLPAPRHPGLLALTLLLGDIGIVCLGTLYSAVLSKTRARHVMLPLLLFPMLIPLLIGAVHATEAAWAGNLFGEANIWIRLLVMFDGIFLAATFLAIGPLMEA